MVELARSWRRASAELEATDAFKSAEAVLAQGKPTLPELLAAQEALAAAASAAGLDGAVAAVRRPVGLPPADGELRGRLFRRHAAAQRAAARRDHARERLRAGGGGVHRDDHGERLRLRGRRLRLLRHRRLRGGRDQDLRQARPEQDGRGPRGGRGGGGRGEGGGEDGGGDDWTEGKSTAELLADGEGALSAGNEAEKRQPADFVLWKASKVGEPAWESPWGAGRPGWHIECSAMASDLLGEKVDLNAGGVDLKFPHHENQIAQCEAHFNCCSGDGWVNYFLHSGHLQIEGLKMSKSLKNFITIKGALTAYSPAQVRFLFLLRRFSEPMEYSENTLAVAVDLERRFAAFGASLATRLKEADAATTAAAPATAAAAPAQLGGGGGGADDGAVPPLPETPPARTSGATEERELQAAFAARRALVHEALCDSIDTPSAMKALEQLVRATNVYMGAVPDVTRGQTLLASVQRYFDRMMRVFGVYAGAPAAGGAGGGGGGGGGAAASVEEVANSLSSFRDQLRAKAIESIKSKGGGGGDGDLASEILRVCDALRDEALPPLGIQLDDRSSGVAQVRIGDPAVLMAEAERKAEAAAKAAEAKAAKEAAKAAQAERAAAQAAVPPEEFFDAKHDELFEREASYGDARDDNGIPLEDAAGEALSKSARKKLAKVLDKHGKAHAAAAAARARATAARRTLRRAGGGVQGRAHRARETQDCAHGLGLTEQPWPKRT